MLEAAVAGMTRSFVVRVSEICCWALGFVGARVRWEDVRLVVTSFIACWGARCCLQAHIRYRVKFVARVLECLLFASSCQLCCQVCSSFGSPATPRGKVVGTILRQRSCCGSLKSSNFSLAFYNIAEGGGGAPSKSHGFLYDKIAHFGGTSFSAAKSLKNGAVPHVTSPVALYEQVDQVVGGVLEAALPRKLFVCLRAAPICVYGLALSRMLLTDLPFRMHAARSL